jgi:signal-transduction protein with cAMP-binding, CBS, and nucleotidyltransferase domain
MRVRDALRRSTVAIEADRTVRAAAEIMESAGVGFVVVTDSGWPIGVVTDRDLVRRVLARGLPDDARVDGVMTTPVVTIDAQADLRDAYRAFRANGVRRLVVVDDGQLIGVTAVDDLLIDLASDLADLAMPVTAETIFGQHDAAMLTTT